MSLTTGNKKVGFVSILLQDKHLLDCYKKHNLPHLPIPYFVQVTLCRCSSSFVLLTKVRRIIMITYTQHFQKTSFTSLSGWGGHS